MAEPLFERFRQHDRLALSRLLSLAARGERLEEILAGIPTPIKPGRVVAITGSGGVGKSTLIGKLIELLRRQALTVAVLACDPQSPLTGGALLGDRFRMSVQPDDEGVFIRSLAAAPGGGAVADHLRVLVRILEAFGFEVILIETVGAGQGETAVHQLADVTVLLLQPEMGDDLQWQKAGLLEIADIIAIHKADLSQAEQVEAQVRAMLALSGSRSVPVLRVSAKTGEGMEALWTAIASQVPRRVEAVRDSRELLRLAQESLAAWFSAAQSDRRPGLLHLVSQWQHSLLADRQAAEVLVDLLLKEYGCWRNSAGQTNSSS